MNDETSAPLLSVAGRNRRDDMLRELMGKMKRVHRARRVRRTIIAGASVPALMLGVLAIFWMTTLSATERAELLVNHSNNTTAASPVAVISRVETDLTIIARWRADTTLQSQTIVVDDTALLAALNEIDRPAGLIRSEGRAWLSRNVIDPIQSDQQQPPSGL